MLLQHHGYLLLHKVLDQIYDVSKLNDIQNKLGVKLVAKYDGRILNEEKVIL